MDFDFTEFCRANNITITFTDTLAYHPKGFCYYDGYEYNVIINSKLGVQQNKKTIIHEFIHIFEDHFSCEKGKENECEEKVEKIINDLKNNYDF